jgi:undecaprenyl-diphosphatase
MWPGTSRSLVTIIAALAVGLTLRAAVEFSFLLGLVTLTAATAYESVTDGQRIVETFGPTSALIGIVVAFGAAWVSMSWMVGYLQDRSLAPFGWYRITAAALLASLIVLTDLF